jgi:site-specific recombinase XerD
MGRCRGNPARRLPLPKVSKNLPVVLSAEQVQQLLAAAQTPRDRLLVLLLVSTGLRRSEVGAIRLEDVNLEGGLLLVRGKGAKQRMVPLMPQTAQAIREYLKVRSQSDQPYLFLNPQGRRLANDFLNRTLRRILARAGLVKRITPPCCATPSPPIWSETAWMSARFSNSSAIPTSKPPPATSTPTPAPNKPPSA